MSVTAKQVADALGGRRTLGRPVRTLRELERLVQAGIPRDALDAFLAQLVSAQPDADISRAAGDAWYDAGGTAVLWVPSVVSPYESNVLFNERHDDFRRLVVSRPRPAQVDPRLRSRSRARR